MTKQKYNLDIVYFCIESNSSLLQNLNILSNLIGAGVSKIIFIGDDPASYRELIPLLYDIKLAGVKTGILSGTHNYGSYCGGVASAVKNCNFFETTFYGANAAEHDALSNVHGSFNNVIKNLKYISRAGAKIGAIWNAGSDNYKQLPDLVNNLSKRIHISYVGIKRSGARMTQADVKGLFETVAGIEQQVPVKILDSFPMKLVPENMHRLNVSVDWGYGTGAVDANGNLYRDTNFENPIENVIEMPHIQYEWNNHIRLASFRNGNHLSRKCQECEIMFKCRGGGFELDYLSDFCR